MGMYRSHHLAARIRVPGRLFMMFVHAYCRLRVEGVENVPSSGPFIIAANHTSHADTAVLYASLPPALRSNVVAAAAKDYFFTGGIKQYTARVLFNTIPITRKPKPGEDPLRHVVRALREDYGVVLYPEGTRSQNGEIGPFRSGIGRLLADFPGTPVIPALLVGTDRVMPKNAFVPRPRQVIVRFGPPLLHLHANLESKASWKAVAQEIREAVLLLKEDQPVAQ